MTPFLLSAPSLWAGKIIVGKRSSEFLEGSPLQRSVLPAALSSEDYPPLSNVKESGDGRHSLKSGCSCFGGCFRRCILKRDQRYMVAPDEDPYSTTVFVTAFFPSAGWRRATGVIIGNHSVALAAHSVRHEDENATEIITIFGMRQIKKCGCFCASKTLKDSARATATIPLFSIHPDYLRDPDSPHDIAVMTMNKPSLSNLNEAGVDSSSFSSAYASYGGVQMVTPTSSFKYGDGSDFTIADMYGSASIGIYDDTELQESIIRITGYPAYVGNSCSPSFSMYSMEGRIAAVRPSFLLYNVDTSHGQSGAGVWRGDEIIGLHTGEYDASLNKAVRIDQSVGDFLIRSLRLLD